MDEISRKDAMERIHEIANDYNLKPSILRDVVEGRSQGMSIRKMADFFGHSKNTISKYSRVLDEEMEETDLAELLFWGSILLGGALLLKKIFEDQR